MRIVGFESFLLLNNIHLFPLFKADKRQSSEGEKRANRQHPARNKRADPFPSLIKPRNPIHLFMSSLLWSFSSFLLGFIYSIEINWNTVLCIQTNEFNETFQSSIPIEVHEFFTSSFLEFDGWETLNSESS